MSLLFCIFLFVNLFFPPSAVELGDREFARINYQRAQVIYDSVLTSSADSVNALWRLARVNVCMADVAPQDQKLALYRQAEAFAHRCIQADSMKPEGHTWRAAALGNIAMFEGGKTKIKLCNMIRQELNRSLQLNPNDDIAYSILGSFFMALGNVSWIERQLAAAFLGSLPEGGYDESEIALRKAIALSPGVIRHHFALGELYLEQDRNREALEEFRCVMTLQVVLASDERTKHYAAELIKHINAE